MKSLKTRIKRQFQDFDSRLNLFLCLNSRSSNSNNQLIPAVRFSYQWKEMLNLSIPDQWFISHEEENHTSEFVKKSRSIYHISNRRNKSNMLSWVIPFLKSTLTQAKCWYCNKYKWKLESKIFEKKLIGCKLHLESTFAMIKSSLLDWI